MNTDNQLLPSQERPTKKQRELLEFIREFIASHGYGPSYREIMAGCSYSSVATVAVHVKNLIARGHLRKKGRNARSLEVVGEEDLGAPSLRTNEIKPLEEKWLLEKIDNIFKQHEESAGISQQQYGELACLVEALKVLGLESSALAFNPRLSELKKAIL